MRVLPLLLLVLLLVACEQAEEFEPDVPSTDVVEEVKDVQEVVKEVVEESVVSAREELEGFCEAKPDFTARYNVKSHIMDEVSEGVQEVVVDGMDFKQETDSDALYVIDREVFVCENDGDWSCYVVPQEEEPAEPDCAVPDEVSVEKVQGKNVAGLSSSCFELTSEGFDGRDVHCFSEDGVLLYSLTEADGNSVERIASYVSLTVNPLRLPAEPEEFQNAQPR